jgi:predicted RNase H-like nuclease (RuvC/YqgF family)
LRFELKSFKEENVRLKAQLSATDTSNKKLQKKIEELNRLTDVDKDRLADELVTTKAHSDRLALGLKQAEERAERCLKELERQTIVGRDLERKNMTLMEEVGSHIRVSSFHIN